MPFTDKISPACLPEPGDEDKLVPGMSCYLIGKERNGGEHK